jgi:hypothetical protein
VISRPRLAARQRHAETCKEEVAKGDAGPGQLPARGNASSERSRIPHTTGRRGSTSQARWPERSCRPDSPSSEFPTVRPDAAAFAERLFYEGDVAAEISPLSKQTIATLVSGASVAGLYLFGGIPMVVFIGGEIGLVVIRSATAVVGALREGARPEVQEFGGDATAKVLNAIRLKLGIRRRRG